MSRLTIVLLILMLVPAVAGARTVDRIAAVVNDEIITTYQLDRELARRQETPEELSATRQADLRRQVLDALIEQTLVKQRIAELGLKVEEEEVEAAIEDIQKQNQLTREQLKQALEAQGMPFETYRENLRNQILQFKLIGREVQAQVEVTNQEIRDYFREHIDEYREAPTVRLSHLSFPVAEKASPDQAARQRQRAQEALGRIRGGEKFLTVLLEFSAGPRAEGGDLGTFENGELTPAFEKAVADLEEGEVSGVIETATGFHILKVTGRSPGKVRQFDAVEDEIREQLRREKTEARRKTWAEDLREEAYIDIRL